MKQPIFILGAHKSGSSLLRSLLDGHKDLFVIPFETHLLQHAGVWVDYHLRQREPANLSLEQIAASYFDNIALYNQQTDPISDAILKGKFDLSGVKERLKGPYNSLVEVISKYFDAAHQGLLNSPLPPTKRVVEKSVENAELATYLQKLFPDAFFIYILRNPYSNVYSLRKVQKKRTNRKYPSLYPILSALKNSYYHLYRNKEVLEKLFVVKYEDLLTSPIEVMQKVAAFLDINFETTLLRPSLVGEPWKGNSTTKKEFSQISSANMEMWNKEINDLEICLVNDLFQFLLHDYQYPVISPKRSHYWPVSGESLNVYVANRLASYFL